MTHTLQPRQYLFILLISMGCGCSHSRPATGSQPVTESNTNNSRATFLFLSDIHLDTDNKNTRYGGDTGTDLWSAFLQKAEAILSSSNPPGFVLYSGDLPAHYKGDYLPPADRGNHNKNLQTIFSGLRSLMNTHTNIPFFYLPGNNDALAGDYYSFTDEQGQTPFSLVPSPTDSFPALHILPGNTTPPCIVSNPHPGMGYYAARPVPGLRLICLNTVLYATKFATVDGSNIDTDRSEQMRWLAGQLAAAQLLKEQVYIAMHIPPGKDAHSGNYMWDNSRSNWNNAFLELTTKYQATISGVFYGHTHMDELRRLYTPNGNAVTQVAISCPGVTPQYDNNPGFKTITYNRSSKAIMDFTTYYTLPSSSTWGNNSYSFNSSFAGSADSSIYLRLRHMPLTTLSNSMGTIYTVKSPYPDKGIERAVEVKWEQ
jgi:sphingomyelin phosphodiesterase acid-like 3